jgi:hypothetical protein
MEKRANSENRTDFKVEMEKPASKGDEFGRLEKLTGKLVKVPKSELDEQREKKS